METSGTQVSSPGELVEPLGALFARVIEDGSDAIDAAGKVDEYAEANLRCKAESGIGASFNEALGAKLDDLEQTAEGVLVQNRQMIEHADGTARRVTNGQESFSPR